MTPSERDRRQQARREGDPILEVLREQMKGFEKFMEKTEQNLQGINDSLKILADVRAGMEYMRQSTDQANERIGTLMERNNEIDRKADKAHHRIDMQKQAINAQGFWLRIVGVAVVLGVLGTAGAGLLWVIAQMPKIAP